MARRLIGPLSAAPLTLPIVRLIQHTMLPDSSPYDVAEVFLSGLIEQYRPRDSVTHPDQFQYDFVPGVRDYLMSSIPISVSVQILKKVGDFINENYGKAPDILAWLSDPTKLTTDSILSNKASRAFAKVGEGFMRKLGGEYVEAANVVKDVLIPPYDFYISHTAVDTDWAEWVTETLELAGYSVRWPHRDFLPGQDWKEEVVYSIGKARHVLTLLSPGYLHTDFTEHEVDQASIRYHQGEVGSRLFIPVQVRWIDKLMNDRALEFLKRFTWINLTGLDEASAREMLLDGVRSVQDVLRSAEQVAFPPDRPGVKGTEPRPVFPSDNIDRDGNVTFQTANIPFHINRFFTGRNSVLFRLYKDLRQTNGAATPLALCGMAGIGKTRVAIEYAYRYDPHYKTKLWLNATNEQTLDNDLHEIVDWLDLKVKGDNREAQMTALRRWLQTHRRWLLVLDNVSDLEIVRRLRPSEGRGHILVTTRTQITGDTARKVPLEPMTQEDGTRFLLRRIKDSDYDVILDTFPQHDIENAREIVRLCGGLPLALDQAGAFIERTGSNLSTYLYLYQQNRMELLRDKNNTEASDYPHTVVIALLNSIAQIESASRAAANLLRFCTFLDREAIPEQLLLREDPQLGSVLGLATSPASQSTALQIIDLLGILFTQSLINRLDHLVTMHPLVQVVIQGSMSIAERKTWAEHVIVVLSSVFPDDTTFDNWSECKLYIAHAWVCLENIKLYQIVSLECAMLLAHAGAYLSNIGEYSKVERFLKKADEVSRQLPKDARQRLPKDARQILAYVLRDRARLAITERKYQDADRDIEEAISLNPGDRELAVELYCVRGQLYQEQKHYHVAEGLFQQAVYNCEQFLDAECPLIVVALNSLGNAYLAQNRYEQAEPLLTRALAISEKIHPSGHPDTAMCHNTIGILRMHQNQLEEAKKHFQRALELYERTLVQRLGRDHPTMISVLKNYADLMTKIVRPDAPAKRDEFLKRANTLRKVYGLEGA